MIESLNLRLQAVVGNYVDAAEDAEQEAEEGEEVDVDVDKEQDAANMAPTPYQENVDTLLGNQECNPNTSRLKSA